MNDRQNTRHWLKVVLTFSVFAWAGCSSDRTEPSGGGETTDWPSEQQVEPVLGKLTPLGQPWNTEAPISWPTAQIMANLSNTAYLQETEATNEFADLGFSGVTPVVIGSMVSYIVSEGPITVVVFRGKDDLDDWLANLKVSGQTVVGGTMHGGF